MTKNQYKTGQVVSYMINDELKSYMENPSSTHILHDIAALCVSQRLRDYAAMIYWRMCELNDRSFWITRKELHEPLHLIDNIYISHDHQSFSETKDNIYYYLNPKDEDIYVCNYCGGTDVTTSSYTNPNYLGDTELSENDDYDSCGNCYEDIEIITLKEWKERIKNGSPN